MNDDALKLANEYSALADQLRSFEGDVDATKKKMTEIAGVLCERMKESAIQNLAAGGNTIYLRKTFFANKRPGVELGRVVAILKEHGFDYMIEEGYNSASLRGRLREMYDEGADIPKEVQDVISFGMKIDLGCQKR